MLVGSQQQLMILRDNGKIHQEVFDVIRRDYLKKGVTGMDIERATKEVLAKNSAQSAFLGTYGFPANIIVSINDTVVHGVPSTIAFEEGDVVTIDFGVKKNGLLTDAAFTVVIGKPHVPSHQKIIDVAREALDRGIGQAHTGKTTGDIGSTIYEYVTGNGFHIVKELTGHGLGVSIHEKPNIFNYGAKSRGAILGHGQYIAIEPIVGLTTGKVYEDDNFAIKMEDGNIGVQEEHCGIAWPDRFEIIV